jgi:hypothetical protein
MKRAALMAALVAAFSFSALAQHNHGAGHGEYQGWASGVTPNCCDNRDCGALKETEHRQTATGPQILIDGEWCPVLRQHYLTKGRSPDWSTPHACIRIKHPAATPGCDRLLCYTPAGGF